MIRRFSLLATALLAFALSSCMKWDDAEYVQDWAFMGTVTTGGVNPVFAVDEGFSLTPVDAMPADTFTVGERYYLHFVLGDTTNHAPNLYPIKIYRYGKTVIKPMVELPKDSTDRWNDQPISLGQCWFSGIYCNIFFASFVGVGEPDTYELVRIKENENNTPTDTMPKLVFEFRHNVPNYNVGYSYLRPYSFDVSSLHADFPNAVRFHVTVRINEYRLGTQSLIRYYYPNRLYTAPSLFVTGNEKKGVTPTLFK